ncbi:alpha-L-fucosidase [Actinopolymorpha singaporensis]|uniref:alpha-L-fucosidase n=1 Tax=Actinopolymorpha singaporensis TaxID=117157 RepID=A0A1H1RWS3_9ACTN|nr:alpha-L-fucosidase [Actinopolymorpha singaporensis]SDS40231.1 alpha-L-fucosidase [Actinopolymorpha singaporensis]
MNFQADKRSLDARPVPSWYQDAKLGIFVHWGLYSVPAYADPTSGDFADFMRDLTAGRDTAGRIPYAEWYLNSLRVPGSPTARHHERTYGSDHSYFDFRRQFDEGATRADFDAWAELFTEAGARYAVMVTRHLDGYPLWPTIVPNPHMPANFHADRDLVGDLTAAVRARGLRMGLYYAGGIDWTFTDRPIRTMTDLMRAQSLGRDYGRYAAAHWRELIEAYQPSILWNDMGWPADPDPHEIFAFYYDRVGDGLVNDRWTQASTSRNKVFRALYLAFVSAALKAAARGGRKITPPTPTFHHDIRTHEYDVPRTPVTSAWELTRGIGRSFGYNAEEPAGDLLTGTDLVCLLAEVASLGGNLLINVGPDGQGRIPASQQRPLRELGAWLKVHGEAIYGTRSWTRPETTTGDGQRVRLTHRVDPGPGDGNGTGDTVYAILLTESLGDNIVVRDLAALAGRRRIRLLGTDADLDHAWSGPDLHVRLPAPPPHRAAHVLALTVEP